MLIVSRWTKQARECIYIVLNRPLVYSDNPRFERNLFVIAVNNRDNVLDRRRDESTIKQLVSFDFVDKDIGVIVLY